MNRREFIQTTLFGSAAVMFAPGLSWAVDGGATLKAIKERGVLRIGVFNGTAPYYQKNLATGEWAGFCVSMGKDLAEYIGVQLKMVETTWGNSVMDLQGDKIDIMFALSNNPERAKAVDFTQAMMDNVFTIITSKDREIKNWEDLNKPEIRVTVDLGSTQDLFARRTLPNCTLVALKGADETIIALQSGRADAILQVALMSVVTTHKLGGKYKVFIPEPQDSQPTTIGVRKDANGEFRDYVDVWLKKRREEGKVNEWIVGSLSLVGVQPSDLPPTLKF
ncbi:transporter substrate-binding domain-containing protein [Brucella intermedia]|uniref:transporter substrate-binding domain-containing protein n=1 Tax=Brucella intermedia TaxID=94625 RepID=UPI001E63D30A|nr:transporter substrate-binding domain-containing protein [Brucella intermedia]MCB4920872.1 transporter substrate-binding domain-containing protein [Brucella intermedia]